MLEEICAPVDGNVGIYTPVSLSLLPGDLRHVRRQPLAFRDDDGEGFDLAVSRAERVVELDPDRSVRGAVRRLVVRKRSCYDWRCKASQNPRHRHLELRVMMN